MLKQFEGTPMPPAIIQPFAIALPWVESVIGLMIILGLKTRLALVARSLMMTVLTFGTPALVEPDVDRCRAEDADYGTMTSCDASAENGANVAARPNRSVAVTV